MRSRHRNRPSVAVALGLLVSLACGTPSSVEPEAKGATAAPAPTPPAPPSAVPAAPAPRVVTHAMANELVQRWLRAQNEGDFEQYAALYATDFQGVRRTRAVVKRFDQASWLADRKRMFGKPMVVEISGVVVGVKDASATVQLEQKWSSGTYSDEGRKRLFLRAGSDGVHIVSEEMLESHPVAAQAGAYLLIEAGAQAFAVLDGPVVAEPQGEPVFRGVGTELIAVSRGLDAQRAARFAPFEGRAVTLLANGKTCEAKLGAAAAFKLIIPYDEDERLIALRAASASAPDAVAPIAKSLWEEFDANVYVAAPLSQPCEGAVLAVEAEREASVLRGTQLEGADAAAFLSAFDAQPIGRDFAQLYARYLDDIGRPRDASELHPAQYEDATITVHRFEGAGRPTLGTITLAYEGCQYDTNVFATSSLEGAQRWFEPLPTLGAAYPLAVFDLGSDGTLEAVVVDELGVDRSLVRLGDKSAMLGSVTIGFFRCGC